MTEQELRDSFAKEFVAARLSSNLGEHELSKLAGTSQTVISHIESGQRSVSYRTLIKLASAMKMKIQINLVEE